MDKKLYTITEAANELNVTRQCIYKKLSLLKDELKSYIVIKNSQKFLAVEGIDIINRNLNPIEEEKKVSIENNNIDNNVNELNVLNTQLITQYENQISDLKKNIDFLKSNYENQILHLTNESSEKNKQLESKDRLLENMQVLLKNQQLLLDEKKKKKWWPFSKLKS